MSGLVGAFPRIREGRYASSHSRSRFVGFAFPSLPATAIEAPIEVDANIITALDVLFETSAVEHLDAAAALLDQAAALQAAQGRADCGALHAEHFGQKLMRQGQGVLIHAVVRAEEPAAAARRGGVRNG